MDSEREKAKIKLQNKLKERKKKKQEDLRSQLQEQALETINEEERMMRKKITDDVTSELKQQEKKLRPIEKIERLKLLIKKNLKLKEIFSENIYDEITSSEDQDSHLSTLGVTSNLDQALVSSQFFQVNK